MNNVIVIFGSTGDLARKKLLPALCSLHRKKQLENFEIICIGRRDISSQDYAGLFEKFVNDKRNWDDFTRLVKYCELDFYNDKDYEKLSQKLNEYSNRIFYLATMPRNFEAIAKSLHNHKLVTKNSKVLFEKPFGTDLKSAKHLNKIVKKNFGENRTYRIDHFLDKELVENIAIIRFTNEVLEPLWSAKHIDHVQITLSEDFGVEERGSFYDKNGAIKDVFQNHLLQLLALVAMEEPHSLDAESIRNKKVKVLKRAKVSGKVITGQYQGYKNEKGVDPDSETETFAAMKVFIDNKKWRKVPFYLVSGKKMKKKRTEVYVEFKNTACRLFHGVCPLGKNSFVIAINPDDGIYFTLNAKEPGKTSTIPVKMEFCYSCKFGPNTPKAYENLFLDAIEGNQSAFVRYDEIEQQWRIIDKIKKTKPFLYEPGNIPEEAQKMIKHDHRAWLDLG